MNCAQDLISEYRVYVVDGEIRAICHYKGPKDARFWYKIFVASLKLSIFKPCKNGGFPKFGI